MSNKNSSSKKRSFNIYASNHATTVSAFCLSDDEESVNVSTNKKLKTSDGLTTELPTSPTNVEIPKVIIEINADSNAANNSLTDTIVNEDDTYNEILTLLGQSDPILKITNNSDIQTSTNETDNADRPAEEAYQNIDNVNLENGNNETGLENMQLVLQDPPMSLSYYNNIETNDIDTENPVVDSVLNPEPQLVELDWSDQYKKIKELGMISPEEEITGVKFIDNTVSEKQSLEIRSFDTILPPSFTNNSTVTAVTDKEKIPNLENVASLPNISLFGKKPVPKPNEKNITDLEMIQASTEMSIDEQLQDSMLSNNSNIMKIFFKTSINIDKMSDIEKKSFNLVLQMYNQIYCILEASGKNMLKKSSIESTSNLKLAISGLVYLVMKDRIVTALDQFQGSYIPLIIAIIGVLLEDYFSKRKEDTSHVNMVSNFNPNVDVFNGKPSAIISRNENFNSRDEFINNANQYDNVESRPPSPVRTEQTFGFRRQINNQIKLAVPNVKSSKYSNSYADVVANKSTDGKNAISYQNKSNSIISPQLYEIEQPRTYNEDSSFYTVQSSIPTFTFNAPPLDNKLTIL